MLPRLRLRTLLIAVAVVVLAWWAWLYLPGWWQYSQSMRELSG